MELFIALIPALVMIALVIITRKVLLALSIGVLLAAFIYTDYHVWNTIVYIAESLWGILTSFDWYMPIVGFVVIIGAITSVLALTGGIRAFADWAISKIKSPMAAKLTTWVLGLLIFIDDYFNALVIGEVTKPITDKYKVSRAKLSYIIDSTSAPVVILMPISTWGAYIIGILGGLFESEGYTVHGGFGGFVAAVPYQFYPITAIIMVFLIARFNINLGAMKEYEDKARDGDDISKMDTEVVSEDEVKGTKATQWNLIVSISVLVLTTLFLMFMAAGFQPFAFWNQDIRVPLRAFMDQDITVPLFFGGVAGLATAIIFGLFDRDVPPKDLAIVSGKGIWGMVKSAVAILILAWMVAGSIQALGVGPMVADIISDSNIGVAFLPLIMFIIAALIAFATGTSWGAFGILLPIAVPIAMATDPAYMAAIVASVLGGAVVGDHSSPVSDTTVLSATGARSKLHAHFISQLPYVMVASGIAALGYLMYGLTEIIFLSYIVLAIGLAVFVYLNKAVLDNAEEEVDVEVDVD